MKLFSALIGQLMTVKTICNFSKFLLNINRSKTYFRKLQVSLSTDKTPILSTVIEINLFSSFIFLLLVL